MNAKDNVFVQISKTAYGANNKLPLEWEQGIADFNDKLKGKEFLDIINQSAPLNRIHEVLKEFSEDVRDEMSVLKDALYGSAIPDYTVVTKVYEVSKKLEKTKQIPNIVIMGGPGSGKTTLAKKLAKYLGRKLSVQEEERFIMKSASDLKGAHIGQTAIRVFDMLKTASLNNQIVYIDEAYHLQEDEFGREAVDFLLPVMSGDRDVIEKQVKKDKELTTEKFSFSKDGNGVPPIWLGGYEHEMRKLLSQNQGLYRRMVKLSLAAPSAADLYQCLLTVSKDNPVCLELFLEPANAKEIRQYFAWGMRPEYMDYFAAYAGVEAFYETAEIYLTERLSAGEREKMLFKILREKREEIKRQHKAILTEISKIEFDVATDNTVLFDDIVCDADLKEELADIVESLYLCASKPEYKLSAPKGAILVGPSGTGKTFIAKALAGEIQKRFEEDSEKKGLKIGFIETSALQLEKRERMSALFETAGEYDTGIIFIDELDAIAGRSENSEEMASDLMLQLLKEMDNFRAGKNVFVIAAAKTKSVLSHDLMQPGRFEYSVELKLPNMEERKALLRKFLSDLPLFQMELEKYPLYDNIGFLIAEMDNETVPEKESEEGTPMERLTMDHAMNYARSTMGFSPAVLKSLIGTAWIQFLRIESERLENLKNFSLEEKRSHELQDMYNTFCEIVNSLNVHRKGVSFCKDKTTPTELLRHGIQHIEFARAVHEFGHFFFRREYSGRFGEHFEKGEVSIFPGEENRVEAIKEVRPADIRQMYLQLIMILGGRIMEEVFFGDTISVDAMQDVKAAVKYAEETLELYGEWIGMAVDINGELIEDRTAEGLVRKAIYDGGRELLFKGWKKEDLVTLIYQVYEQERITENRLLDSMFSISLKNLVISPRKYKYRWNKFIPGMITSALVIEYSKKKREEIALALRNCGILTIDFCMMEEAQQYISLEKGVPYDLVVCDYWGYVYTDKKQLASTAFEVMEIVAEWKASVIGCVPLGEYLLNNSGKFGYTDGNGKNFLKKLPDIPMGRVWYIEGRDMTDDFRSEIVRLKEHIAMTCEEYLAWRGLSCEELGLPKTMPWSRLTKFPGI